MCITLVAHSQFSDIVVNERLNNKSGSIKYFIYLVQENVT